MMLMMMMIMMISMIEVDSAFASARAEIVRGRGSRGLASVQSHRKASTHLTPAGAVWRVTVMASWEAFFMRGLGF